MNAAATGAFVARKRMTVFGVRYERGAPVDLESVPPVLRRRLVEQKRVVPRAAGAAAGPAALPSMPEDGGGVVVVMGGDPMKQGRKGAAAEQLASGARCGDHGGRMKNGQPCGRVTFGLCQHHKN